MSQSYLFCNFWGRKSGKSGLDYETVDVNMVEVAMVAMVGHFFSFAIESYIQMKRILHLVSVKNITFKSCYNWFKIDFLRLLQPPTAIFSYVHSHLSDNIYI